MSRRSGQAQGGVAGWRSCSERNGDSGLLKQVFVNFALQCCELHPKSQETRGDRSRTERQNGERVVLSRDNGVGFRDASTPGKLFWRLSAAAQSSRFRRHRSRGWRLAAHHSEARWPDLGGGGTGPWSTFFFTLSSPENKPREPAEVLLKEKKRERGRRCMSHEVEILLVEDSAEDAELTIRALRSQQSRE